MTIDDAKTLLPGNRVFDWALAAYGTVHSIGYAYGPDTNWTHAIKVTVNFDDGEGTQEYYDNEVEYLERA